MPDAGSDVSKSHRCLTNLRQGFWTVWWRAVGLVEPGLVEEVPRSGSLIDLVATSSLRSLTTIRGTEQMLGSEMGTGRLIRVEKYRNDPKAVAYIVAIADPDEAIALIRKNAATTDDEIRDLGRVSDALLNSLKLQAGEFIRADASRGAPPAEAII